VTFFGCWQAWLNINAITIAKLILGFIIVLI
jgi:hypothetical protein